MPRVSTYLNFPRSTEQAFVFYRSVFGGDFFWGSYFGSLTDRFGVHWMFNCNSKT